MELKLELVEKVNKNGKKYAMIYAIDGEKRYFVALFDKYNYAIARKLREQKTDK